MSGTLRPGATYRAGITLLVALGASLAPLHAGAQAYPTKPIRLVVPFPAGGGGDILARLVMTEVAKELRQPLVVENLAGAGGNIGSATAARAAADGYTLLYGTNGTLAINHTLYKSPGFDPLKDLDPVSRSTTLAAMVVVRPGLPAADMKELLGLLKSNPGKYTFGSAGNGTTSHLAGEILKSSAGLFVVHIPYRGGAPAMTDLIGGQIDMMIEVMPSAAPQVRGGRIRGLAVSTARRVDGFPDLPTVAESGVPGFDVSAWDAILAPAGTPKPIVQQLNAAIRKVLQGPELIKQLGARGAAPAPTSPEELGSFIGAEIQRWGAAVKRSAASVD